MADTLIQFYEDKSKIIKATEICERLGVDLQTYMRICLARLIDTNGFPFPMVITQKKEQPAISAMKKASKIAVQNGISEMTLDEINEEITRTRKQ